MTEIKSDELFMDFMEAVINDETIDAIEVNYYKTGGCYVSLYNKQQHKICPDHEFSKAPDKSNRLSGEMGHLESHNPHIQVRRSILFSRDTYEIVKVSAPVASVEKTYFDKPYVSKHEEENKEWENVLEVLEYELSQPQVNSATLNWNGKTSPTLKLTSGPSSNMFRGKETVITLDPKNYGEAVRFILSNYENLFMKYSLDFIPNMGKTPEETPIAVYRNEAYAKTLVSEKEPVCPAPVIIDIIEFLQRQFENNDVELFYIDKMESTGIETVRIELTSGAAVEFRAKDGDLEKIREYSNNNDTRIKAEGFWSLSQTQHGGGSRKMIKIRALPVFGKNEEGKKVIMNMKRFFLNSLASSTHYAGYLYGPEAGETTGNANMRSSNNLRFFDDIETTEEVFAEFCSMIAEQKEELEKKYDAVISISDRVYFEKNYMIDYRLLLGTETLNAEMFKFLSEAYQAGCNIVVQGNTGSGKTTFIRALYEAANDTKITALLGNSNELLFPDKADNFIALRGSGDNITRTALKMSPARIILDDLSLRYSYLTDFLGKCAKANIQMISTLHGSIEKFSEWSEDFVVPFELEVEIEHGKVKAINQLVVSGRKIEKNVLWKFEDGEFREFNLPSRTMRRKIEQNLTKAKADESKTEIKGEENVLNPLVTISQQEKEELMQAMETIKKYINLF